MADGVCMMAERIVFNKDELASTLAKGQGCVDLAGGVRCDMGGRSL